MTFSLDGSDLYIGIAFDGGGTLVRVNDYQAGDLGLQFQEIVDPLQVDGVEEWFQSAKAAWDGGHSALLSGFSTLETIGDLREPDDGTDVGTGDDDNMAGSGDDDSMESGGGDDSIDTLGGNDTARGGQGNDLISGGAGEDFLYGESDDDTINGGDDNDTIYGGSGFDLVVGGAGDDTLFGNSGDDLFVGGGGFDTIDGGIGWDSIDYSDQTASIEISLNSGSYANVFVGGVLEDQIRNIERIIAGTGDDVLIGDDDNNVLEGGGGADTMSGGIGHDSYTLDDIGDLVIELLDEGSDSIQTWLTYALPDHVERLELAEGAGAIDGTGNALDNILVGNTDENVLTGGGGNDTLYAGDGDDILDGGAGADTFFGEAGADTFVIAAGMGGERIGDFTGGLGASDVIEFHGLGISTFTELQTYMSEWEGSTYINFDENNFIVLEGVIMSSLSQDDFVFV